MLLAVNKHAGAQELVPRHFEAYTINEGLSQGFISAILQDKQGFMWFGTNDGLNRYDGYSFSVLRHDPTNRNSLGGDDISCLFEDSQQRLWIGLRGKGIDIFDPQRNTFQHIRQNDTGGLRSDFIYAIDEDKTGVFWIQSREGIERLEMNKGFPVSTAIRMDSSFARQRNKIGMERILIDNRNHKFITTNTTVYELMFNDRRLSYKLVERFRFTPRNTYAIGVLLEDTINHCFYLNSGDVIRKFPDYNFNNSRVIAASLGIQIPWAMDKSNQLWLLGHDRLIQVNVRNYKQRHIVVDEAEHLKTLQVATVFYTDRTGVVWIGSSGFGLLKHDPATTGFHHMMRGKILYQLLEDREGRIITNNLDAVVMTEDSIRDLPGFVDTNLVGRSTGYSFTKDTAGSLWFADAGRLLRYDPVAKTVQRVDIPATEYLSRPFPLLADRNNNVWMGYNRYLMKYDRVAKTFSKYEYPVKFIRYEDDFLQSMYQVEDLLWLGSFNGLFCFDMKREKMVAAYTNNENDSTSISNNLAFSFCADVDEPERYLWIGTKGGGLNRLDKTTGKFIHFNTRQGLPNNVVYGILPDFAGNLWLSTNKGLSAFNMASRRFRNFDVSDGLQGNEFNRYAYLRTSEGIMVFGGLNGINYFRSDEIRPLDPPKVVFTDFRLFNRSIEPGPHSLLTKTIEATRHIVLRYEQNVVTFQFAAMDYRKKGSIRYRYQMKNFDKDWIYAGATHEATYTNLDPGSYEFAVQASFENGAWSTESSNIELRIITPWYRTWWFYLLVTVVISTLVYCFYRLRIYQLQRLEGLRNRIARDLHDEIGSSISTIAIYSKIAQEQMDSLTFDKEPLLKKINDFATEIMASMNDIVWSINAKNDAFEHIISHMRDHAIQLFDAQGCRLHFNFDDNVLHSKLSMERRREFYLIYKESLNNIAKYAEAKNVWISLAASDNKITLKIKDDGKGFDPSAVRKGGNGLVNMHQRAAALHAKISVVSSVGGGTEIVLGFTTF